MNGPKNQPARPKHEDVGSIPASSRYRARARTLRVTLAMWILCAGHATALHGQQPSIDPLQDPALTAVVTQPSGRISPTGALLRSFLIPGWGQAAAGSTQRGAVYFTFESLGLWMILKTSKTLGSARDIQNMRRREVEDRLISGGTVDGLAALIDADTTVVSAQNLVQIRKQQREDWLAFGVFALLLGGADAFVAAHLADFPEPLEAAIRPLPDMGVEFGFRVAF
jgi:hypothetical protein